MQKVREHWSSHIGFVFAAAGSAIGLGVLWKFPYVTGENGGGLFVLIYALCTFFIGIPVFVGELLIGRRAQRGAVGTFTSLSNHSSFWNSAGWLGVISSFIIMSFYSVIGGWGLNYTVMSLMGVFQELSAQQVADAFDILYTSGDITLLWHFLFTMLAVLLVLPGVKQGIEYWSKFMMGGLFLILLALFAFSTTLKGFPEAVQFVLYPDFSKFHLSSALEALGLAFFTLSLGQGIMITYGSYMVKADDMPKVAITIGIMIIVIAVLAALMIFPIIFTFGFSPEGGRGLIFKTLPVLFAQLPGSLLISTAFFILFTFAALSSAIAFIEVIAANMIDLWGWTRKRAVLIVGIACFLFGIPSALSGTDLLFANWTKIFGTTFFATVEDLVSIWFLPIGGLLTALFVGWSLPREISKEEFLAGTSFSQFYPTWIFFMRWVIPIAIVAILLEQTGIIRFNEIVIWR